MCEPASIAAAATLGLNAASTTMTVLGQVQANKAASAAADYQAQVARNNAIIANRFADDAIERGKVEESQHRQRLKRFIGQQRVSLAASGVDIGEGSAVDVVSDTAGIGELDAIAIRRNAEREALGFRTQGMNFRAQERLSRFRGKTSPFSPLGTALTGASQLASKYGAYRDAGIFGP